MIIYHRATHGGSCTIYPSSSYPFSSALLSVIRLYTHYLKQPHNMHLFRARRGLIALCLQPVLRILPVHALQCLLRPSQQVARPLTLLRAQELLRSGTRLYATSQATPKPVQSLQDVDDMQKIANDLGKKSSKVLFRLNSTMNQIDSTIDRELDAAYLSLRLLTREVVLIAYTPHPSRTVRDELRILAHNVSSSFSRANEVNWEFYLDAGQA